MSSLAIAYAMSEEQARACGNAMIAFKEHRYEEGKSLIDAMSTDTLDLFIRFLDAALEEKRAEDKKSPVGCSEHPTRQRVTTYP